MKVNQLTSPTTLAREPSNSFRYARESCRHQSATNVRLLYSNPCVYYDYRVVSNQPCLFLQLICLYFTHCSIMVYYFFLSIICSFLLVYTFINLLDKKFTVDYFDFCGNFSSLRLREMFHRMTQGIRQHERRPSQLFGFSTPESSIRKVFTCMVSCCVRQALPITE